MEDIAQLHVYIDLGADGSVSVCEQSYEFGFFFFLLELLTCT